VRLPGWGGLTPDWVARVAKRLHLPQFADILARLADIRCPDMATDAPPELPLLRKCGDGSIEWLSLPDATGLVAERISDVTILLQINRRDRDPVLLQIRAVGSGAKAGIRAVALRGE